MNLSPCWKYVWCLLFCFLMGMSLGAPLLADDATLPPPPEHHFTDGTHTLPQVEVDALNQTLEQFERETSNQLVVWLEQSLPQGAVLEDYSTRLFNAWRIGREGKNNGILLTVFLTDHKLRITRGLGLTGTLSDDICAQIISKEITPRFKAGDVAGGLKAGVEALMKASQHSYEGTGKTVHEEQAAAKPLAAPPLKSEGGGRHTGLWLCIFSLAVIIPFVFSWIDGSKPPAGGNRRGQRKVRGSKSSSTNSTAQGLGAGYGSGYDRSGNSGSGPGGSGFSGGGGSSDGGGASGNW